MSLRERVNTTRLGEAGAILSAKAVSETWIKAAEAATLAAATPGLPAAKMPEETTKATAAVMSSTIVSRAGGADIHHNCATPLPLPPHRRLVVIGGSLTIILIKRLP